MFGIFFYQLPNVHPELNPNSADINEASCLRTELSFFFLSSVQRWKLTGDVPFSMFVQFLKIIIVTFQVCGSSQK